MVRSAWPRLAMASQGWRKCSLSQARMVAAVLLRLLTAVCGASCRGFPCMSEPRRWSGGAARVAEERPLGEGRRRPDALPLAFLFVVDLDQAIGGDVAAVGGYQQGGD